MNNFVKSFLMPCLIFEFSLIYLIDIWRNFLRHNERDYARLTIFPKGHELRAIFFNWYSFPNVMLIHETIFTTFILPNWNSSYNWNRSPVIKKLWKVKFASFSLLVQLISQFGKFHRIRCWSSCKGFSRNVLMFSKKLCQENIPLSTNDNC